jgi:hypothetical protein
LGWADGCAARKKDGWRAVFRGFDGFDGFEITKREVVCGCNEVAYFTGEIKFL